MSKTKIGLFSILMFGVMMLLIPATSIANAQEYDRYYAEKKDRYNDDYGYENDRYYDEYRQNDYRNSYDNNYKKVDKKSEKYPIIIENKVPIPHDVKKKKIKPAIVEITKELFVCDDILNATDDNISFDCVASQFFGFPAPPESTEYVSCDTVECPGIDESDFAVTVLKDAALADDLSSTVPTPVDLEKINFVVFEDELGDRVNNDGNGCHAVGFHDGLSFTKLPSENELIQYEICVLYEGDCQGTINPGEAKECTVKNFIYQANNIIHE